jgi:flagellin-specific chaperone FliS
MSATQEEQTIFIFDEPLECVQRAIRGLDRKGFNGSEEEALNRLQIQFPSMTRNDLSDIYRTYGDVQDFEI